MAAIWCNGGPAVVHTVGVEDSWPDQAVDIVRHLDSPSHWSLWFTHARSTPSKRSFHADHDDFQRATDCVSYLFPSVRNLICDMQHGFVGVDDCIFPALEDSDPLARSLNLLLSHCVTLRAVMHQNTLETEFPYPLTSFVVCALRQVFWTCFPEAETLEYVECALPRTGVEDVDGVLDVTSTTMIAALVVVRNTVLRTMGHENDMDASPNLPDRNACPTSPDASDPSRMDIDGPGRSSFPAARSDDVCIAEEDGSPSAVNEGYAPSECAPDAALDNAAEFHVISNSDRSSSCAVLLCCAEVGDRIYGLMASMLHQRRALGASGPVMGLQIAKFSAQVKLLVGWMEDSEDSTLPRIHIAVPIDCISEKHSSASFDLSEPGEIMRLGASLLSWRAHGEADVTSPPLSQLLHTGRHSWRADTIDTRSSTRFNPEAIDAWVESLEPPSPSRFNLDQFAHSSMPPKSSEREEPLRRSSRQEILRKSERSSSNSQLSHPSIVVPPPFDNVFVPGRSNTGAASQMKNKASMAGSGFLSPTSESGAKGGGSEVNSERSKRSAASMFFKSTDDIMLWLVCRGAFLYAITLNPPSLAGEPNVYEYRQFTSFARISELRPTKYNQVVPDLLRELSDELFDLAKKREDAESTWPIHRLSMLADRNAADSAMTEMKNKPDLFIKALSLAHGCRSRERISDVRRESEFRHDWDALLFGMLMHDEVASALTLVSLEQTLNLPANLACLDNVPGTYNREDLRNFAHEHFLMIDRAEQAMVISLIDDAAPDCHYRRVRQVQERAAADDARQAEGFLQKAKGDAALAKPLLLKEPLTAKCDAFGMVVVSLVGDFNAPPLVFHLDTARPTATHERYSASEATRRDAKNTNSADVLAPMYDLPSVCPWLPAPPPPEDAATPAKSARRGGSTVLRLPAFVIEYKKEQTGIEFDPQGVNQTRIYLVSALRWLEQLGVTDFPVYGMTTDGSRGVIMYGILVTTATDKEGKAVLPHIELRERDARCYDLKSVLDTIDFALFLRRLVHNHIPKLKNAVEEALKKCSSDSTLTWGQWTMAPLKDRYPERPTVPDALASQGSHPTQSTTDTGIPTSKEALKK